MDVRIEQYKAWYRENYLHEPPIGLVEKFCAMYGITGAGDESEELPPPDEAFWRTMEPEGKETDG